MSTLPSVSVQEDLELYRFVVLDPRFPDGFMMDGQPFTDNAYSSASMNANKFLDTDVTDRARMFSGMILDIKVTPENATQGVIPIDLYTNGREAEVLLPRGTTYYPTGNVTYINHPVWGKIPVVEVYAVN